MRVSVRQLLYFVTAASLLLGLGKLWVYANSPTIPLDKLRQLSKPMTVDEVHVLLGEPNEIEFTPPCFLTERYTHSWKLGKTELFYDTNILHKVDVNYRYCPDDLKSRWWCLCPIEHPTLNEPY